MCKCGRSTREDGLCEGLHSLNEQEYKEFLAKKQLLVTNDEGEE